MLQSLVLASNTVLGLAGYPTRIAIGLALMVVMGTCTGESGQQASAFDKGAGGAAATASKPAPKVPPKPLPPEPYRGDFIISGDMAQGGLLRGRVPSNTQSLLFDGQKIDFSSDGFFLVGVDRDAPLVARLEAWRGAGEPVVKPLAFSAGAWRIQNINTDFRGGSSSAEYDAKRPAELAEMTAARNIKVTSDGWRQQFIWPVTGRMSGVFGSQRIYRGTPGNYHNGVDIAVPTGTPIVAPADGVVVLAANRPFTLEGYLLIIDHGMGLVSTFLHNSRLDVQVGDVVKQGQQIALVGTTGRSTGPHMHWGMRWKDRRIDPQRVAGPMVIKQAPVKPAPASAAKPPLK
jgi:biotin carboxyl carrier protein